mmetsp:Transcript_11899/g.14817  ORF Transcript_11899/g.14817 Transcript_11899/m.14817 type:complete len:151 (+) Transcript_11899:3-455(+)
MIYVPNVTADINVTTTPTMFIVNMQEQLGQPTLMIFNGGKFASWIDRSSKNEIEQVIMAALRDGFPSLPDPIDIQVTRWAQDPNSFGSYSYITAGSLEDDQEQFEHTGSKSLFFAGEHTIKYYFQTVHGAYLSGRREASRIINLFKLKED